MTTPGPGPGPDGQEEDRYHRIAHDLNNLFQLLGGCLQMIERRTERADVAPALAPLLAPILAAGREAVARGALLAAELRSPPTSLERGGTPAAAEAPVSRPASDDR